MIKRLKELRQKANIQILNGSAPYFSIHRDDLDKLIAVCEAGKEVLDSLQIDSAAPAAKAIGPLAKMSKAIAALEEE